MKKSFMTRVLATGLSLAMAFSLTAATNVSVASAASTPAMASKQFAVRVGGAAKSYKASAATQKSYKISKATVGNTDKATVKVNSSKKSIKVTPGTVTGSTVVKISFKNIKTKKTTSKKYRCVVKAAVVEKQAIVKAEATGVKTITLTMAKDVASVASPVAITVKKGASEKAQKATAEGKTITLAMDTKLTEGTYDVSIKGLETDALTATVVVASDEYLKSYEIMPDLAMERIHVGTKYVASTTSAIVYYNALNQYDEPMLADEPVASSSFGSAVSVDRVATATMPGKIRVGNIPSVLAIPGTKGTVSLVDGSKGINKTGDVAITSVATAAEATVVGTYNVNQSKMAAIKEGDTVSNFYILLTAKDQYGNDLSATDFVQQNINTVIAGPLSNIALYDTATVTNNYVPMTVDGKEYIAIKLAANDASSNVAKAGKYTLTIVNPERAMLISDTYDVIDNVVIKSISITAANGLYNGEENELAYTILDTEGNEVKSYSLLKGEFGTKGLVNFTQGTYGQVRWEKNTDGTAKLVYDLTINPIATGSFATKTSSYLVTFTAEANVQTSGNYIVKPVQLSAKYNRYVKTVYGIKDSVATVCASGQSISFGTKDIIYLDQYSNKVTSDDRFYNQKVGVKGSASLGGSNDTAGAFGNYTVGTNSGCAIYIDDPNGVFTLSTKGALTFGKTPIKLTAHKQGTATVYLKFYTGFETLPSSLTGAASTTEFDAKFVVSAVDTKEISGATLAIDKILGHTEYLATYNSKSAITKKDVTVVAIIGGQKTVVPDTQWEITGIKNGSFTQEDQSKGVETKTATLEVTVSTYDGGNNDTSHVITKDYTISKAAKKATSIDSVTSSAITLTNNVASGKVNTASAFAQAFTFKDQYDGAASYASGANMGDVKYTVTVQNLASTMEVKDYEIVANGSNKTSIRFFKTGTVTIKIVAELNGATKTYTKQITIS